MARNKQIWVYVKHPGKKPHGEIIDNTLEALQKVVGGYIEHITIAANMAVICNEEGIIQGLPYNCHVAGVRLVGTIVFVGVRGENYTHCPAVDPELWIRIAKEEA